MKFWKIGIAVLACISSLLATNPQDIAEKSLSSIVFIAAHESEYEKSYGTETASEDSLYRALYECLWPGSYSHGTGFLVSSDGYIVTCEHVIQGATSVVIGLWDKEFKAYSAEVIGSDSRYDIAVLKIKTDDELSLPFLKFVNTQKSRLGDPVLVIGNPDDPIHARSVNINYISGIRRADYSQNHAGTYLELQFPGIPGASGSPIIDMEGEVAGVLHSKDAAASFATDGYIASKVAQQFIENGKRTIGYFGLHLIIEKKVIFSRYHFGGESGALISEVVQGSAADSCGLKKDDYIIEVNGEQTFDSIHFVDQISTIKPGEVVDLLVKRDEELIATSVTLTEKMDVPYTF